MRKKRTFRQTSPLFFRCFMCYINLISYPFHCLHVSHSVLQLFVCIYHNTTAIYFCAMIVGRINMRSKTTGRCFNGCGYGRGLLMLSWHAHSSFYLSVDMDVAESFETPGETSARIRLASPSERRYMQ